MSALDRRQAGYTIVEVLVAISLFSVLSVGFYQVLFSQARGADSIRSSAAIGDEARLGFARMVRDTREADAVTAASPTSFTIRVNFNGDAYYQNPNPLGDAEILTYAFDSAAGTITLNGQVLMRGVSRAGTPPQDVFQFSSNNLDYDWDGNGTTTWNELDSAGSRGITGVGDGDGVFDGPELPYITSVSFNLKLADGGRSTELLATSQMRNRT